ncbi:Outer membrane protein YopM, partial [Mucuna pruriens]
SVCTQSRPSRIISAEIISAQSLPRATQPVPRRVNTLHLRLYITSFNTKSQLNALYLNLDRCENLKKFSIISKNMLELRLGCTKIQVLLSSFADQSKLKWLHLMGNDIERLPSSFNKLTQLLHLHIIFCKMLYTLAELPLSLKILDVTNYKSLQILPNLPPSLETQNAKYCSILQSLPKLPISLKTLEIIDCISIQNLPKLPSSLETLNARYCLYFRLSSSLKTLDVTDCKSLQSLPELSSYLETPNAKYCSMLQSLPKLPLSLKTLDVIDCKSFQSLPKLPLSLETLNVGHCSILQSLPELPPSLKTLDRTDCKSL